MSCASRRLRKSARVTSFFAFPKPTRMAWCDSQAELAGGRLHDNKFEASVVHIIITAALHTLDVLARAMLLEIAVLAQRALIEAD